MTTSVPGTTRRSRWIVLAATAALMLSLLPFASVSAAVPTVTSVTRADANPTSAGTLQWTVTFSEAVAGVDTSDFSLATGGTAAGSVTSVSAGTTTFTVTVGSVTGDGSLGLNVDAGGITSVSTGDVLAAPFTGEAYTVDNTAPIAPGTPDLATASDLGTSSSDNRTADNTPTFTGTGENGATVTLFAGAVNVGTGLVSGGNWSITSTSLANATYSFTATQTDAAGNGPSAASGGLSVIIDTAVPLAPSQPDLDAASDTGTNNDNITSDQTPTFSGTAEAGSTVELFAGAVSVGTDVATGGAWQITAAPALASGTYSFTARATNINGTSVPSAALSVTIQGPLTVTINQASSQTDPTGASPINFTVVFSSPVSNFTNADVTISGTAGPALKTVTVTGSGTTYNVAVSGMTTAGTVIASIGAGLASDASGNVNAASTSTDNQVTWDPTPGPTVTINQASGQADPTGTSPINFTIVFSAPVTGFTGSDVVITGTATGTKTVTITGAGPTYNAAVTGMTSSGTVIATVPAGAATSVAGSHPSQASTSTDNTVTFRLASKWIVTTSSTTPNPGSTVTITAQLADASGAAVPAAGVVVTWTKTGTGGSFSSPTSTTNASGVATVSFTVGTVVGTVHTVTATSAGGITGTSPNITVTLVGATLTLTSSASITTYRQFVTLAAQFSGSLGANRVVAFQRMTAVVPNTWVTIGSATTNATGRATFSYGPPYNTQFRAVFAGAVDLGTVTSNTITVNVRHKVTLRSGRTFAPTSTVVRSRTRITYTAVERPIAPAGTQRITFLIYKRVGGVWTFRTSATVSSSAGVATFSWRWGRGEWYVRARANATIYNLASLSPLAKVTVR